MEKKTEQLMALLTQEFQDLLAQNVESAMQELLASPEQKLTVALSAKLTVVKSRLYCTATISYSRKFSDEIENSVELDDENQLSLPTDEEVPRVKAGK